jgi:uncharacterized protein YegL
LIVSADGTLRAHEIRGAAPRQPEAAPKVGASDDLGRASLGEGAEPRLPLCLLVDISSSIAERGYTDQLNKALCAWTAWIGDDPQLRRAVEIAVVVMGPRHAATTLHPPGGADSPFVSAAELRLPPLTPAGTTPLGKGLDVARTLCQRRRLQLAQQPNRHPRLVVISDGEPTDRHGEPDPDSWRTAAEEVRLSAHGNQLFCVGCAIGPDAAPTLETFADPVFQLDPDEPDALAPALRRITRDSYYTPQRPSLAEFFDRVRGSSLP